MKCSSDLKLFHILFFKYLFNIHFNYTIKYALQKWKTYKSMSGSHEKSLENTWLEH